MGDRQNLSLVVKIIFRQTSPVERLVTFTAGLFPCHNPIEAFGRFGSRAFAATVVGGTKNTVVNIVGSSITPSSPGLPVAHNC